MVTKSNATLKELLIREEDGAPFRVGVVGAGAYGRTLISQLVRTAGLRASLVCDLDRDAATRALVDSGVSEDRIRSAESAQGIHESFKTGASVTITDLELIVDAHLDVIVDCTGYPEVGARLSEIAATCRAHLVMVNVEADATIGVEAAKRLETAGCVYTLADGDQPSLILGLADWAAGIGFDVVCGGKWTDSWEPGSADEMLSRWRDEGKSISDSDITYLDGTKAQVELASAANCLGFAPDVPGMHGPALRLSEIPDILRRNGDGSLFSSDGVVDFVNCVGISREDCHPGGVFVVARSDNSVGMEAMSRKGCVVSSDGGHVLFYRPYHLIGVETVRSVARTALRKLPTAAPLGERSCEVVAITKSDASAGDRLSGLGTDVRGILVDYKDAQLRGLLPLGLAGGCVLRSNAQAGTWLTLNDVELPDGSVCLKLREDIQRASENAQGSV